MQKLDGAYALPKTRVAGHRIMSQMESKSAICGYLSFSAASLCLPRMRDSSWQIHSPRSEARNEYQPRDEFDVIGIVRLDGQL